MSLAAASKLATSACVVRRRWCLFYLFLLTWRDQLDLVQNTSFPLCAQAISVSSGPLVYGGCLPTHFPCAQRGQVNSSESPPFDILVLAVWCCLHRWPSCVPGVAEGLSSDAYQHSEGTQCPNYRGFPSVAGMSACLASTCILHISAGSVAFSAQTPLWCAWGV